MRYQGDWIALAETEQHYMFTKRWSILGFGGFGFTSSDFGDLNVNSSAWNLGGGFRYLIARQMGLRCGLDVGRGPEQWAVYLVFGSSWSK